MSTKQRMVEWMVSRIIIVNLFILFASSSDASGWIEKIGNELTASDNGVDVQGATLLLNDQALTTGTLFAFSAFYRKKTLAIFQIWRPTNQTNVFRLVAETRVTPTVEFKREDIYIESLITSKCIQVKNGDRLGCYTEIVPAPIAYTFNARNPASLMNINSNISSPYQVGDAVEFDTLTFPYLLSLTAYIYTENITASEEDYVDCPKGLLIPEEVEPTLPTTTSKPPPTGAPGATGATGPAGRIGRPGGIGTPGKQGATGLTGDKGTGGSMGATGMIGPPGVNGTRGESGDMGFTGATGISGLTGPKGPMGATGSTGEKGPKGRDGMDGIHGKDGVNASWIIIDGNAEAQQQEDSYSVWSNPVLVIILVIWLIVVTIILLILTCCFCWYALKMKRSTFDQDDGAFMNTGYLSTECSTDPEGKRNRLSSFEPGHEWIGTMKPDDGVSYENSTITRDQSQKQTSKMYDENSKAQDQEDATQTLEDGTLPTVSNELELPLQEQIEEPSLNSKSLKPNDEDAELSVSTKSDNRWSQSQDQVYAY